MGHYLLGALQRIFPGSSRMSQVLLMVSHMGLGELVVGHCLAYLFDQFFSITSADVGVLGGDGSLGGAEKSAGDGGLRTQ